MRVPREAVLDNGKNSDYKRIYDEICVTEGRL